MKQLTLLLCAFLFFASNSFAQPANNNCSGATVLYQSTKCINVSGTLFQATNASPTGTCGSATATTTYDVWYSFTSVSSQATITLSSLGTSLTAANTFIQVLRSTDNSCTVANFVSMGCQNASTPLTVTGLTPGNRIFVRIYVVTNPTTGSTATWGFNICATSPMPLGRLNEVFADTIIGRNAAGFDSPWEITYEDREDSLWFTENKTYRIQKMGKDGNSRVILDLSDGGGYNANYRRTFTSGQNPWPQGGLMGFAIHPDFLAPSNPKNFVYAAYVRDFVGPGPGNTVGTRNRTVTNTDNGGEAVKGDLFRTFIVRFTYNTTTKALENPVALCDTITGSGDHNSGRMIIAPMTQGGTDYFLFYSCGDMGAGQFYNAERIYKSQMLNSYEGKILRFNLEEDGDAVQNIGVRNTNYNRWIPNDNPYNGTLGAQSAVWNIGHRNVQGLAYTNGKLFGSSHGPFSDDEVNYLQGNRNYGHPLIIGKQADNNYNNSKAAHNFTGWGNEHAGNPLISTLPLISSESGTSLTNYTDPLFSFFDGSTGATQPVVNGIYLAGQGSANSAWPSIAPSGMEAYNNTKIPGWNGSLFLASLKRGYIMRIKPNTSGTGVTPLMGSDTSVIVNTTNRFRDLAFDKDGWSFYGVVDRSGSTSGPTATNPVNSSCPGCVIKYTFLGYTASGSAPNTTSNVPTDIAIDSSLSPGCVTGTSVTISPSSGNANLWVPITGPNGNLIAELNANGNNLGNVTTSFFTRTGAPVRSWGANRYVNRNVTINVQTQPSTPVSVRLYITAKELADIIATPGSGIASINDIGVFKNADACGTTFGNNPETGQAITGRYVQSTFGHALQFNVTSFSTFYFFNSSATLPFELITLNGKPVNDAARLEWIVKNEKDVNNYTIERSVDGVQFTEIGTVTAKNGTGELKYQFTDFNAVKTGTVVYYRIRSNEASGIGKYTNIISVNFAIVLKTSLAVAPNPAKDKTTVTIQSTADETVQLKVLDNTGRMIKVLTVNLVKGKNNLTLDMSDLKAGMYYIDVTGKSISEKTKLIKQ
jgi:glucose/arabinose dehydrogenase